MIENVLASIVRTAVPIAVGWVVSFFAFFHATLTADNRSALVTLLTAAISAGYYALVRLVETKVPAFGLLLGYMKQPTGYSPSPTSPVAAAPTTPTSETAPAAGQPPAVVTTTPAVIVTSSPVAEPSGTPDVDADAADTDDTDEQLNDLADQAAAAVVIPDDDAPSTGAHAAAEAVSQ